MDPVTTRELYGLMREGVARRHWYAEAHAEIVAGAKVLGTDPDRLAGILAITSPRVSVRYNLIRGVRYVMGDPMGMPGQMCRAIDHFEQTGEIVGPKTTAFRRALMLDVHMARAVGVPVTLFKQKDRAVCETMIRSFAWSCEMRVAEVQAAVWCAQVERTTGRAAPGYPVTYIINEIGGAT